MLATTTAKADIISNCFRKFLILPKQPKNLLHVKDKAQEGNTVSLYISNKFDTFIPFSATYFMEVTARALLKVGPRASFRSKNP